MNSSDSTNTKRLTHRNCGGVFVKNKDETTGKEYGPIYCDRCKIKLISR